MDSHAFNADGIILINRIKPHTDYRGPYGSGLVKMAVIGLKKHDQALKVRRFGVPGLRDLIPQCAEKIFGTGEILGGVAIVDWMGKDISGVGMDTNIIGRIEIRGETEPDHP